MKQLRPIIEQRCRAYEQHPFIAFLQDSERSAEARMAYAGYAAHWVMTFADINRFVLSSVPEEDALRSAIDEHVAEDSGHWRWFLRDLRALGQDPSCRFSEALGFLWSEHLAQTRLLSYKLIAWAYHAPAELKMAIIEVVEAMGNVWLRNTVLPAGELGTKLVYFGEHHLERETGHAIGSDEDTLGAVVIPEHLRADAERMVHEIFDATEAMNTEVLAHAKSQRGAFSLVVPNDE